MHNSVERANFHYLVADIAWFGLAFVATNRFLSIFAIRLGATEFELGLLAALPGLMLLLSTGFSLWWRRHYGDSVAALKYPGFGFRLVFLLPAFAPFFVPDLQIEWLLLAATLPAIPQGIAGTVFVVMLRESVKEDQLTRLLSVRSVALNVAMAFGALFFGFALEHTVFPYNYQVMFLIAFLFGLVSHWYVMRVRVVHPLPMVIAKPQGEHVPLWRSFDFRLVVFVVLVTHLTFLAIVPLVPLYLVQRHGAAEGFMALFALAEMNAGALAGLFTHRLLQRFGTRPVIAWAMLFTAIATVIIIYAPNLEITLIAAAITGAAWTVAGTGIFGFFIEHTPSEQMQQTTVAYQQVISLSLFIGPMIGSSIAGDGKIDLVTVLLIGGGLRLLAAVLMSDPFHRRVPTPAAPQLQSEGVVGD